MTSKTIRTPRRTYIVSTAKDPLTDSARGHRFAGRATGPDMGGFWVGRLSVISIRRRR